MKKLSRKLALWWTITRDRLFRDMLMDYRVVEGRGFYTIDRRIAKLFLGFPYAVRWLPVTDQQWDAAGVYHITKKFPNKTAATNYLRAELARIDSVLDQVKADKTKSL